MNIRHFDIKTPHVTSPETDGWVKLPFGYYRMDKCISAERRASDEKVIKNIREAGNMVGGDFQQDCLLSILVDIDKEEVNFIELGAGWGRLCLNVAGAIDYKTIPLVPKKYRCLAVEAEPLHFKWLERHLKAQKINGSVVFGAVSKKNGTSYFDASDRSDFQYGQAMSPMLSRRGIPSIQNLRKIIARKTIKVPMYSLDQLITDHAFNHVDIVQMDVQGVEYDVIQGAVNSIGKGMIDYFLINIHVEEFSKMLPVLLSHKYNLVLDLKRANLGIVPGFPPIQCNDGIQLYKRKDV